MVRRRSATPSDVPAIAALVEAAFAPYIARIGRPPAPMHADHAAAVTRGDVLVLVDDEGGAIVGVVELVAAPDHVLVDIVAVAPERQGEGHGRALVAAAEERAAQLRVPELRLYTNEAMTENLALYHRLGWRETGRAEEHGFRRVFFASPRRPRASRAEAAVRERAEQRHRGNDLAGMRAAVVDYARRCPALVRARKGP